MESTIRATFLAVWHFGPSTKQAVGMFEPYAWLSIYARPSLVGLGDDMCRGHYDAEPRFLRRNARFAGKATIFGSEAARTMAEISLSARRILRNLD
jgi:hypothetical protein